MESTKSFLFLFLVVLLGMGAVVYDTVNTVEQLRNKIMTTYEIRD